MSTALVLYKQQLQMADTLVKSKRFPGEQNAAEAFAKIQAGHELGLQPVQSLMNIHMVQGRVTLGSGLIAAKIKGSGKYNYKVTKQTNEECELEFFEKWDGQKFESVGSVSFSLEDAKTAGLLSKNVWKQYPSDMLFARALTRGARRFTPDVFGGPVYTREELEDGFDAIPVEEIKGVSVTDFLNECRDVYKLEKDKVREILTEAELYPYNPTKYKECIEVVKKFADSIIEGEVV